MSIAPLPQILLLKMMILSIPAQSYSLGSTGSLSKARTPKNALVNSAEGFLVNESLQCLQSQGEFTKSERSFGAKALGS
jgi:hypothetical protein